MKCQACGSTLLDDSGTFKCITCDKKNGKLSLSIGKVETDEVSRNVVLKPGDTVEIYVKAKDGTISYLLKSNIPEKAWDNGPLTDRVEYTVKLKATLFVQ